MKIFLVLVQILLFFASTLSAKVSAINPSISNVNLKVLFVGFAAGTQVPANVDSVLSEVTDYYSKLSLGQHHIACSVIRRTAPNQSTAYLANHAESFYLSNEQEYDAKIGLLQKEIFEKAYNEDSTVFKNVDFIFFVPLSNVFIIYTGMGRLGGYNAAGLPRKIFNGPGATALWLESTPVNAWNLAHEYGHQLGLNHPPQNDAYRYYGWYDLMHNHWTQEPFIPPLAAPQFAFNNLWMPAGSLKQILTNQRNVEISPFMSTHSIFYFGDTNQNAFIIANYQRESYDSIYAGTGLLIWHTQGYDVWDIEAASGNWLNGAIGVSPVPNGPPTGSDQLDQKVSIYHTQSSDFFDGQTFSAFSSGTNPNTNLYPADTSTRAPYSSLYSDTMRIRDQTVPSHFAMLNLHRKAATGANAKIMIADFFVNNWSGHITQNTSWIKNVHLSGDVIVDAGVTLTIGPGVTVSFEPHFDDQKSGNFPAQSELIVNGTIAAKGTSIQPVVFTSAGLVPANGDWGGITIAGSTSVLGTYTYLYAARQVTFR